MNSQLKNNSNNVIPGVWYAQSGKDNDVVLSTRVRLARNLANFTFPNRMQNEEKDQVQAIVFDAFNHFEDADSFQAYNLRLLDRLGIKILEERSILEEKDCKDGGLVMRNDGKVCCTVNMIDHVRISSIFAGLNIDEPIALTNKIDDDLQKSIQFAANYDFGYLTSQVKDAGSGLKISIQLSLPCLSMLGKLKMLINDFNTKGIILKSSYGAGEGKAALGSYYQISTSGSLSGNELDQVTNIVSCCIHSIEAERLARLDCMNNMPTYIKNTLYRCLAIAKNSLFIGLRESIELISGIKLGLDCGIIKGISYSDLTSLLYRVREGNIDFIMNKGNFTFEKDIINSATKKNERLRALLLQEALEEVEFVL